MKLARNSQYLYSQNGITEENGWKLWYDWSMVKRHIKIIIFLLIIGVLICAFVFREYFAREVMRPSQILCKPPKWCKMKAPQWRF